MLKWFKSLVGDNNDLVISRLQKVVQRINALEPQFEALSDEQLANKTAELRQRLDDGEELDDLLPDAFATVREASRRTIGLRHYDVQLIGGAVLHQGKIAEMKTGEGKTLVATLPLYLNALPGEGVHLVTTNDYLARRDAGWMSPIFHLLGLSVGFIGHEYSALFDPDYVDPTASLDDERLVHWRPCTRREAYAADITYGTNNEFGFDYLRDNMIQSLEQAVQRGHTFAIVDEVDNILIDEARTPLIISGPAARSSDQYARFAQLVRRLRAGRVTPDEVKKGAEPDGDVLIDLKSRSVLLTEQGLQKVEEQLEELGPNESVYDPQHSDLTHYLENALKAQFIFHRDKDYVVASGEVVIVDEFTGRTMPGRRWSDGLHQAVEAKEGVDVKRETVTYATITFQNYFRMYQKLAGMTGTAATEKEEFGKIYNLEVVAIPTNKATARKDLTDQIYRTEDAKFSAVVRDIKERQEQGQPVLVGTTSVETSERLSQLLKKERIPHQVLNAKQNQDEARVIAQAGQPGTVTIATNMAGRGTDILLGGNAEALAARYLEEQGCTRDELIELARRIEAADKEKREEPLRLMLERSGGRLDQRLVDALRALRDEYEAAMRRIDDSSEGEYLFLIRSCLDDLPPSVTFEQKFELVRTVLRADLTKARKLAREMPGVDEERVAAVQRLHSDYMAYHSSGRDKPAFLAGLLFDRVYAARASLIQHTLRGEIEAAQRIVAETPGLHAAYIEGVQQIQRDCVEHGHRIREAGGLHVVGTERHEARRIDNQLRGRAGRQGDPGSSRFYLSLEDELMRRFGRMDTIKGVMQRLGVEDDVPIEAGIINRSIEGAQVRVEGYNFDVRKHTVDYDNVMNKQRVVIYARRRGILEEADELRRIEELVARYLDPERYSAWLRDELTDELEATRALPPATAQARIAQLLPEAEFDVAVLRASDEAERNALLEPIIARQHEQHLPVRLLVEQLADIIELPEDAEEQLRAMTRAEGERYVNELWREQNEGDLEERVKELFATEFASLIDRYHDGYDDWLRAQIVEAVADASNPATDEVNVRLVQRRLSAVLPEVGEYDPTELDDLSPDKLQRELEGLIAASRERGHNIDLLAGEVASLVPLLPGPQEVMDPNLMVAEREQVRERYIEQYTARLGIITAGLDEEERSRVEHEAVELIREQLRPLFIPGNRISGDDLQGMYNTIVAHGMGLLRDALAQLDPDATGDMLDALVDKAFEDWRNAIGVRELGNYQRTLMLQTIDMEWQQYLTAMDDLRQGIGLQAVGQKDPLVQYQTAGYRMFGELLEHIDQTVVRSFFRRLPEHQRFLQQAQAEQQRQTQAAKAGYEAKPTISGADAANGNGANAQARTLKRELPKVGRNDPCPCGSGKKYKYCHGKGDAVPAGRSEVVVAAEDTKVAALAAEIKAATEQAAPTAAQAAAQPAARGRSVPSNGNSQAKKPASNNSGGKKRRK
jgi:preprotein translocase SecA subunit